MRLKENVRSVVNGVFRFINGNRLKSLKSNEANGNDGMAAMRLEGSEADGLSSFFKFIDNMNFVYPDTFSGCDSFNVFYEFCVAENLAYGAVRLCRIEKHIGFAMVTLPLLVVVRM